jgi:hypothetical protein
MKKLTLDSLDDLLVGSAILGSGGGGDSAYSYMMAKHQIEKFGPVPVIKCSELKEEDLIIPVGIMGAPLVEFEKIQTGLEYNPLIQILEKTIGKKATVIMPIEVAGGNAFLPTIVANQLGLPVLDADMMGRAFPEVQMCSSHLFGAPSSPGFVADCLGNTVVIHAKNNQVLEKIGRQITISMGSWSAFALCPLSGPEAQRCTIHKSISKAISIGKAHREAKKNREDPLEAVLNICKGVCIGSGKITDIDRAISKGFLKGNVTIQNKTEKMEICFQNEFLLAKCNGKVLATTPDIITLLEQETGEPVTSDSIRFGLKVNLIVLPSPPVWTTKEGLSLVGPRHFGYETDYQPIQKCKTHCGVKV